MMTTWTEIERIDYAIKLNYMLVKDGEHPAVDFQSVWNEIDKLLDERLKLINSKSS